MSLEVAPATLALHSKVAICDFDDNYESTYKVVAHGSIVSLAGGMMHGWMIEEGNASVLISSVVPGSETLYLFEPNNNDDPPMQRLGDALNSITKWPVAALKAI